MAKNKESINDLQRKINYTYGRININIKLNNIRFPNHSILTVFS